MNLSPSLLGAPTPLHPFCGVPLSLSSEKRVRRAALSRMARFRCYSERDQRAQRYATLVTIGIAVPGAEYLRTY